MATKRASQEPEQPKVRTRLVPGLSLIVAGLLILALFGRGGSGQMATFGLTPIGDTNVIPLPDMVLPVQPAISVLAALVVFVGAWQLARGIRATWILVGVVAFCFVAAFLIWAATGKSMNLVGMLNTSLVRATPIALAALCGVISERSAVVNIAIEGIMLMSALAAVVTATLTRNLYAGLTAAILVGAFIAAIHAVLVIRFKVDQIISGVAINIFGTGATSFIASRFLE